MQLLLSAGKAEPTKKMNPANMISISAKHEHALVGQMLLEIVGPGLTQQVDSQSCVRLLFISFGICNLSLTSSSCVLQELYVFREIVLAAFSGLPEPPAGRATTTTSGVARRLERALRSAAESRGLVPHPPFIDKCLHLHTAATFHHGLFSICVPFQFSMVQPMEKRLPCRVQQFPDLPRLVFSVESVSVL